MVNSKPPAPELATMAPLLRRLSIERPWQPIALMVLARLGAGLALAKPASRAGFIAASRTIAASPWIAAHPSMAQGPIP
jgi:hypothetical protein